MTTRHALLLFDIDGTLLLTGRAGIRAMSRTFDEVFGIADAFADVSMAGRTDSYLLSRAFAKTGVPDTPAQHERFKVAYVQRLSEEIVQPGTGRKGLMPGVQPLLAAVRHYPSLHMALLTGNYRAAAMLKLAHFGLDPYFSWGAFSDDAADRNALVPVARARAVAEGVPPPALDRVVVIGDTPFDVECAKVAGATAIAVATGGVDRATLEAAGADAVLDDLSDTGRVLELLL
jgi:phosphoglycolate phosphatase-like HAD superfamily hydrolase